MRQTACDHPYLPLRSAEHAPFGQRRYFATFEALAHFLWQQLDEARPADGGGPGTT